MPRRQSILNHFVDTMNEFSLNTQNDKNVIYYSIISVFNATLAIYDFQLNKK